MLSKGLGRNSNRAVIVFKIEDSKQCFPMSEGQNLSFLEPNNEWQGLIKYYRNRKKVYGEAEELVEKARPYLYGPVSLDGCKGENDVNWTPEAMVNEEKEYMYQICIKNKSLARKFFNACEIFVIFLV